METKKPSLKDIIGNRKDADKVKVYNKENRTYTLSPVNYGGLLYYLVLNKAQCFYDSEGHVMVVEQGLFSIKNYDLSKVRMLIPQLPEGKKK